MKYLLVLLFLYAAGLNSALAAQPGTIIVASSFDIDAARHGEIVEPVKKIYQRAAAGTQIIQMDAATGRILQKFTKQDKGSRRMKLQQVFRQVRFLEDAMSNSVPEANAMARIDAIKVFKSAGRLGLRDAALFMIGNPVQIVSGAEIDFSFYRPDAASPDTVWRRPSYGQITQSQRATPYGAADMPRLNMPVYWWNCADDEDCGGASDFYRDSLMSWWGAFIRKAGGTLAAMHSDPSSLVEGLINGKSISADYPIDSLENHMGMVSVKRSGGQFAVRDYTPQRVTSASMVELPRINHVVLFDYTASMKQYKHRIIREIIKNPVDKAGTYMLIAFSDFDCGVSRVAHVFEESNDPAVLMEAFRAVETVGGRTFEEAHADALELARIQLEKRGHQPSRITIYSDDKPHEPEQSPSGLDYRVVINALLDKGHTVEFVKMYLDQDASWVPRGVKVRTLGYKSILRKEGDELVGQDYVLPND